MEKSDTLISIETFCKKNDLSKSFFYKLRKTGLGPRITKVGRKTLISVKDMTQWQQNLKTED